MQFYVLPFTLPSGHFQDSCKCLCTSSWPPQEAGNSGHIYTPHTHCSVSSCNGLKKRPFINKTQCGVTGVCGRDEKMYETSTYQPVRTEGSLSSPQAFLIGSQVIYHMLVHLDTVVKFINHWAGTRLEEPAHLARMLIHSCVPCTSSV